MAISKYTARLSEKIALTERFYSLKFELVTPNTITFLAGQYILVDCPLTPQKRQYSIASAPRMGHAIELLIERIPNGVVSGYLTGLTEGSELSFYAPAGEFVVKETPDEENRPLIFIATGSGIAPLRSIVLDQLRSKEAKRQITLYIGMRHADDLFWLEQLEEFHDNFPNFTYHITLSKPPDDWRLCRGRVTDCLSVHDLPKEGNYYLCGNPQMITDVTNILLSRSVSSECIHSEKFS